MVSFEVGFSNVSAMFINLFQPGVAFQIETSYLISREKHMTCFYMDCNTALKLVNVYKDAYIAFFEFENKLYNSDFSVIPS